jgi:hypothetical protein
MGKKSQFIFSVLVKPQMEGKGKEREKSFLFCLYDPAINIYVFMLNNNNNNNNIVFRQIKHIHIKHTYIEEEKKMNIFIFLFYF